MSGFARREQLVAVGRSLFAEKGFGATSVEEIAARAKVSKPVVYEHFGGKEGLYAVIVDREVQALISSLQSSLESSERPRLILENATLGLLDYIERNTDGFRVLVRDAPSDRTAGSFSSVMGDVATSVEHIIAEQFKRSDFDVTWSPLYAQMLVGLIAQVGQWWLDDRRMKKDEVAAHVVNLIWNGQRGLRPHPTLRVRSGEGRERGAGTLWRIARGPLPHLRRTYDEAVAGIPATASFACGALSAPRRRGSPRCPRRPRWRRRCTRGRCCGCSRPSGRRRRRSRPWRGRP